jgi:hypothetical protein
MADRQLQSHPTHPEILIHARYVSLAEVHDHCLITVFRAAPNSIREYST